ncbi:MAG TPA: cytidylate kinase family protein [Clostridia bacterium]
MAILTLSRQLGSLGDEIAETLARRLGWELITRSGLLPRFFGQVTDPHELRMLTESAKYFLHPDLSGAVYKVRLERALLEMAQTQSAILVGFGAQAVFADDPMALHVRVIASQKARLARVRKQFHVAAEDALQILETSDRKQKRFVSTVFGIDLTNPSHYHLSINTDALSVEECAATVFSLVEAREALRRMEKQTQEMIAVVDNLPGHPMFKNPAEIELATILDMYQIEWRYEPRTFPVEWDAEGNVSMAFSPDFYLPGFNTYIELTTMNQKYVTMKNRKAKKVRELYPGTNIKIMYKKDFQSLIERFHVEQGE